VGESVDLSIVTPMYNEEANVEGTVRAVAEALGEFPGSWELLIVDDGSTDASREQAEAAAARDGRVRVLGYTPNAGRGRALRTGFDAARGECIVTIDFDLSYEPSHIVRLHGALQGDGAPDVVLASAYMPGGSVEGISFRRLLPSWAGNVLLRLAWPRRIYTSTCVVRGYRRAALEAMALTSDRKEIHLEILEQAFDLGLRVAEIPGHLRARAAGKSKAKLGRAVSSHLRFLARRRPLLCAAAVAAGVLVLALAAWLVWR